MFKTAFSYAYHFVFLQETVGVFNFEKKSVTLEQLVLWEGAHKGSSAAVSFCGRGKVVVEQSGIQKSVQVCI